MARVQLHRFVDSSSKPAQRPPALDRRGFLQRRRRSPPPRRWRRTAFARNFEPGAEPTRYPEPDVVVLDKRFKYKLGNTPIQRLYTRHAVGRRAGVERRRPLSLWSDIPNDEQLRWIEEDGHV